VDSGADGGEGGGGGGGESESYAEGKACNSELVIETEWKGIKTHRVGQNLTQLRAYMTPERFTSGRYR
jgi:hypothetical protein